MEHAVPLPDSSTLAIISDASVDLDLMDELLSADDAWFGTQDLADLLQQGASTPPTPLGPSYSSPPFKMENMVFNAGHEVDARSPHLKKASSSENPLQAGAEMGRNMVGTRLNSFIRDFPPYSTRQEPGKAGTGTSGGLRPRTSSGPLSTLQERLNQALTLIKDAHRDGDMLVQIWVPIKKGDRQVLTTYGQPFSLNPHCRRLLSYRHVSADYQFSAEGNPGEALGLPGRVFLGKLPEWSPDVRYFSRFEYPRVNYARHFDVRGTLALPIFDRGSRTCLGVIEAVMTTEKINYRSDLEKICSALQAVDLGSTEALSVPQVKMKCDSYLAALPEISTVLRAICHAHGLPLAQTWMPCIQQGRSGSRHSEENYKHCVSTVDAACFVNDPSLSSFHEACSEHHLLRGQGVVGRAFMTNQPCFSSDITAFCKTEYPLSHHARMFGLQASVAIRLRSVDTGMVDFVLEFFLPKDCIKSEEQKVMLSLLSTTMQQVCQSLRVVTSNELEDENVLQVNEQLPSDGWLSRHVDGDNGSGDRSSVVLASAMGVSRPETSWISDVMKTQPKEKSILLPACASLEFKEEIVQGFSVTDYWGRADMEFTEDKTLSKCSQGSPKDRLGSGDSFSGEPSSSSKSKVPEKKRAKLEKTISFQVLQQYFAGSLKDAAKSIGVCPTTLKRICRQHGITRWPSRKIKKVGHSLRKLQVVIDSIQGVDSSFQLSSLYSNVSKDSGSDLCTQKETGRSTICMPKQDDIPESSNAQHELFISRASGSNSFSSSCSQSSGSSHSCSSKTKESSDALKIPIKEEVPQEDQSGILKRSHSQLELYHSTQQTPKTLARSQSLKSFGDHHGCGSLSPSCQKCAGGLLRVKAIYGKEKIRFKLQPTWGFQELKQEIAKRFNIGGANSMVLKYLDDDSEWVLLTCDADLQECTDIYRSSHVPTIKISVHHVGYPSAISLGSGL
ncbi:hypothetical protein Taro_019081 [Colocasia esculenta]|uniref:Uncharacterized protein n=1 Tax=Colocasia esculenta TaxID=4460 RepID=A0A843UVH3_COLES|nr:hypothetical protein [Colocasia esculenta]